MKLSDVLSSEDRWCQNCSAKDASGKSVLPENPDAVTFCLMGAMFKAYPDRDERVAVLGKLKAALAARPDGCEGVVYWNDQECRTFAEVRELIAKAGV